MKLVPLVVSFAVVLAPLAAQIDRAQACLKSVREHVKANDLVEAARKLRKADLHLGVAAAGAERDAVQADILSLVPSVDPLMPRRRDLERALFAEFEPLARSLIKAQLPRAAGMVAKDCVTFDEIAGTPLQDEAKAATDKSDSTSGMGRRDVAFATWYALGQAMRPEDRGDMVAKAEELHADLGAWASKRVDAAKKLKSLASAYASKGGAEIAFDIIQVARGLDSEAVEKVYTKISSAAEAARVERHYQRHAKPHMDAFKRGNFKVGGSKGWKVGPRVIQAPKASTKDALILSKNKLTGDFRIEVELQFENMLGQMQVVLAYRSKDDYVVLDFERPRASFSNLRIVRYVKGSPNVLAETRAQQTMRSFFQLTGEIVDDRIKVAMGKASCRADSPISTTGGVSFGFSLPPLAQKPKKKRKNAIVRLRNLVVTEL